MESIEDLTAKLRQVTQIFRGLGISANLANEFGNVKLLKLIYLFYIHYVGSKNGQLDDNDAMSRYKFYAWPYGPVEPSVYDIIGIVREHLDDDKAQGWGSFKGSDSTCLGDALKYVAANYIDKSASELVRITHENLHKWRETPMYGEMRFDGPTDFKNEYNQLPNVQANA